MKINNIFFISFRYLIFYPMYNFIDAMEVFLKRILVLLNFEMPYSIHIFYVKFKQSFEITTLKTFLLNLHYYSVLRLFQ